MQSVKYIDLLKEQQLLPNDFAASKKLGWTSGQISQYRNGKRIMDNEACLQLAIELKVDPMQIIMAADIDRAARAGQRSMWEVFMTRTAGAASVFALVSVTYLLTPSPANAAPALDLDSGKLYIMLN